MSLTFSGIVASNSLGKPNTELFDDIQKLGSIAALQIKKIIQIDVYWNPSTGYSTGIETSYLLNDGNIAVIPHGLLSGSVSKYVVGPDGPQRFVGVHGYLDERGNIRTLGFLVYNSEIGEFSSTPSGKSALPEGGPIAASSGYATLADSLVGFAGTTCTDDLLRSLVVYKRL